MGRAARNLKPIPNGLTLREAAAELSRRLGRSVEPQQVHYVAKRKGAVEVGCVTRTVEREITIDAVAPSDLDELEAALRELTDRPQ